MVSASLRAYQGGEDTSLARRQIVIDYLNTVPLSAKPGYGEVNGIGDGMWVWYGRNFDDVKKQLNARLDQPGSALANQSSLRCLNTHVTDNTNAMPKVGDMDNWVRVTMGTPAEMRLFKAAFANFDPVKVAAFGPEDRARLMSDPGIIRSNAKIDAAISGARLYLDMMDRGEDFGEFLWSFVGGAPIQNEIDPAAPFPVDSPESIAMAKALKARGFKFCGPVILYAFMQATGMVNDHLTCCFRHGAIKAMGQT